MFREERFSQSSKAVIAFERPGPLWGRGCLLSLFPLLPLVDASVCPSPAGSIVTTATGCEWVARLPLRFFAVCHSLTPPCFHSVLGPRRVDPSINRELTLLTVSSVKPAVSNIKVFTQHKVLSGGTILRAYTHSQAPAHRSVLYTAHNSQHTVTNGDLRRRKIAEDMAFQLLLCVCLCFFFFWLGVQCQESINL